MTQQRPFCHFDRMHSRVSVISTGAQRSGEIWPAIGLTFPFKARFLRYVMLRRTLVAMTKCVFASFAE